MIGDKQSVYQERHIRHVRYRSLTHGIRKVSAGLDQLSEQTRITTEMVNNVALLLGGKKK